MNNDYKYKTPDICKALNVSRMTLWSWQQRGLFTPPRNMHGDRVVTKDQLLEIQEAFGPGGRGFWHFQPRSNLHTQDSQTG